MEWTKAWVLVDGFVIWRSAAVDGYTIEIHESPSGACSLWMQDAGGWSVAGAASNLVRAREKAEYILSK